MQAGIDPGFSDELNGSFHELFGVFFPHLCLQILYSCLKFKGSFKNLTILKKSHSLAKSVLGQGWFSISFFFFSFAVDIFKIDSSISHIRSLLFFF